MSTLRLVSFVPSFVFFVLKFFTTTCTKDGTKDTKRSVHKLYLSLLLKKHSIRLVKRYRPYLALQTKQFLTQRIFL